MIARVILRRQKRVTRVMLGIIAIEVGEEVEVAAEVEVEVEADEVVVAVAVIAEAIEAIEAEIEIEIVAVIGEGEVIIIIIVSIVEVEDIKSSIHQCSMGLLNVAVCFIGSPTFIIDPPAPPHIDVFG